MSPDRQLLHRCAGRLPGSAVPVHVARGWSLHAHRHLLRPVGCAWLPGITTCCRLQLSWPGRLHRGAVPWGQGACCLWPPHIRVRCHSFFLRPLTLREPRLRASAAPLRALINNGFASGAHAALLLLRLPLSLLDRLSGLGGLLPSSLLALSEFCCLSQCLSLSRGDFLIPHACARCLPGAAVPVLAMQQLQGNACTRSRPKVPPWKPPWDPCKQTQVATALSPQPYHTGDCACSPESIPACVCI